MVILPHFIVPSWEAAGGLNSPKCRLLNPSLVPVGASRLSGPFSRRLLRPSQVDTGDCQDVFFVADYDLPHLLHARTYFAVSLCMLQQY